LDPPIRVISKDLVKIDDKYIKSSIDSALLYRKNLFNAGQLIDISSPTCGYRLINGGADGLPGISVDIYSQFAQIINYSRYWNSYINILASYLIDLKLAKGIYLREKIKDRDEICKHFLGELVPDVHSIEENGLKFLIDLSNTKTTGVFLDMRKK